ncbi:EamA family transporter [Maribellus comscasis]|uniref:EamA family transporter n=1 Tax=Maribellus comscasis TaxID=2681766 RepID=A0A6I6JS40_9BACT|nr:DMT family transporter [Maribellus comscasis]QGY43900.1 EamA family transporter [Maribellus comscasis]
MKSIEKAYLFAGLSVFFWSTVATSFKLALRGYDFIQLVFYISAVSVLFLFVFIVVQGKLNLIFKQSRKKWLTSMGMGALNPLIYYLVLFKAYSLLPAQIAQPINMVWPIVLALLSVPFLKQKIGWVSFAALFISFTGVVFISSQGGIEGFKQVNVTGVILALITSVLWAIYWILNVRDKRDEVVKLFLNYFFGLLYLTVAVVLFSDFEMELNPSFWAAVYSGIFEVGITYVLWLKAMNLTTSNAKIGNLVFLAPFISLIFIHFILKEIIYITTFIGLVFIVAGIFVQQLDKTNQKFS